MAILRILFILLAAGSFAATRDFPVDWTHDCQTTEGDTLDPNGDGTCELITFWRLYQQDGSFITAWGEDGARARTVRHNYACPSGPWCRDACFVMTATMDDWENPGQVSESAASNVGACKDVVPGNPNSPVITN